MNLIHKIPYPITGLMLGLAALGNLYSDIPIIKYSFGSCALIIGILVILKAILIPASLKNALDNPVVGSVLAAFPMAVMLLSTYIKPMAPSLAFGVWITALILHGLLIMIFTLRYIVNLNIKKVFPSYFVMYVGIIAASVSSPAYNMQQLGQYIFWFGLCSYILLLPIVMFRVIKVKNMPSVAQPTLIIFAAPASLCLVGYMNAFAVKWPIMIYSLALLALIMTAYALTQLIPLLKRNFMPSYSAFTFPLVISAIAAKIFSVYQPHTFTLLIATTLKIIATLMVLYVLVRYMIFLIRENASKS